MSREEVYVRIGYCFRGQLDDETYDKEQFEPYDYNLSLTPDEMRQLKNLIDAVLDEFIST
jgi:hypothetical protein